MPALRLTNSGGVDTERGEPWLIVQAALVHGEPREASWLVHMIADTTSGTQVDTRWGAEPLARTFPPIAGSPFDAPGFERLLSCC